MVNNWLINDELPPICISIEVSNNCNMNCLYCYNKNFDATTTINFDYLKVQLHSIITDTGLDRYTIRFLGGEPLLHVDLIESICNYLSYTYSKLYFTFSIFTNGTIVNKKIINLFNKYNFIINLSIDGNPSLSKYRVSVDGIVPDLKDNVEIFKCNIDQNNIICTMVVYFDGSNQLHFQENIEYLLNNLQFRFVRIVYSYENNEFNKIYNNEHNKEQIISLVNTLKIYMEEFKNRESITIMKIHPYAGLIFELISTGKVLHKYNCSVDANRSYYISNSGVRPCHIKNILNQNENICNNKCIIFPSCTIRCSSKSVNDLLCSAEKLIINHIYSFVSTLSNKERQLYEKLYRKSSKKREDYKRI